MTIFSIVLVGVRALFRRVWFGRAMFVSAVFFALESLLAGGLTRVRASSGFSTWRDFLLASAQEMRADRGFSAPSPAVALNLTFATALEMFVTLVLAGILSYGLSSFLLRMVRSETSCGYAAGAFSGFARPLGLSWLAFRQQLQVALWSLLLIVPGVVAWYRYRAAWYLKVENPDWSAGRCLSESGSVMRGHKGRCFLLDLSYVLLGAALAVSASLVLVPFLLMAATFPALRLLVVSVTIFVVICSFWCVCAGQTVFYISIRGAPGAPPPRDNKEATTT